MTQPATASPESTLQLALDTEPTSSTATIHCHGRLVAGVTQMLYDQVCQLLPHTRHIALDLSQLTYMDSMGLGTLVRIYVSTKAAGTTLQLTHLGKRIRELLGVAGLLNVFSVLGEHGVPMKF